jgi:adenine-specific DNA-methyltransferase
VQEQQTWQPCNARLPPLSTAGSSGFDFASALGGAANPLAISLGYGTLVLMEVLMEQLELLSPVAMGECPAYLQEQLITYIGNKRQLLPFIGQAIEKVLKETGKKRLSCLDLFSGTGVVSRFLKRYSDRLIANDLESYSRVTNEAFLTNKSSVDSTELNECLTWLKSSTKERLAPGFIAELYSPKDEDNIDINDRVFYTRRNACYLDTARILIDDLPENLRMLLLAPLLAKASVHANTSGVFKGFYKNRNGIGQYGGNGSDALSRIKRDIIAEAPRFSRFECEYTVYQEDANKLVRKISQVDFAYFDPPYNQHPYGSNYFMLNLLVDYQRPSDVSKVSGIPNDWNRSSYNKRAQAFAALFDAIDRCPASYILISYNSEGFVSHIEFMDSLRGLGKVDVCKTPYNTFRGSRNLRDRSLHVTEYLYLLSKD